MSAPDPGRCTEMHALLAERASGPLEDAETAALDRHLQNCSPCRAAAVQWETLFSHVALPAPRLKQEAAMRDLPQRLLLAWQRQEQRRRRAPAAMAAGLLAVAAVAVLVLWHAPQGPTSARAPVALATDRVPSVELEWADGPTWEMDEADGSEASSEDAALLDGLALEGDGAFSLGDSG
jgi:ferric-dicitrate binding protein FerR (iron transport regulator)